MTLAGRTPGLISPEPGSVVETSLVSELQTHSEAKTGYAEHNLPPAGGRPSHTEILHVVYRGYYRSIGKSQRKRGGSADGDV